MQSCAHFTPPTPTFTTQLRLPPTPASPTTATQVKEHPESRSSSPLMALLSGASLFMSLPMCGAASSCQALQQGRARLLFYFMFSCSWRAEMSHAAQWQVLLDVMIASWAPSLHSAVSEYDENSFYGTPQSLLACGRMAVFTAHKWNDVHIFWVIRRTVRRHTQRETHTT